MLIAKMPLRSLLCGCGKPKAVDDDDESPDSNIMTYEDHYILIEGETATFGMNTLWPAEAKIGRIPGIIRTRVGYVSGTEAVEVQFDKHLTTYPKILDAFWKSHDRCGKFEKQHLSVIFYHNPEQQILAEHSFIKEEPKWKEPILTEIIPIEDDDFQTAHASQQKYYLQRHKDILEMLNLDTEAKLIRSHAACILNSYLGGFGTLVEFDADCRRMKLPENMVTRIRSFVEELRASEG